MFNRTLIGLAATLVIAACGGSDEFAARGLWQRGQCPGVHPEGVFTDFAATGVAALAAIR